jgi:thymidine kinase
MSLHVIVGPMFAGKTSEIQSVVRRYSCIKWNVLVVKPDIDNRYESGATAIINHDRVAIPAHAVSVEGLMSVLEWEEFRQCRAIVIEEGQFFRDCLIPFVRAAVDEHSKHVTVVGLDGDAERRPFGDMLQLIPLADTVEKKTAMCKRCNDGTVAIFTRAVGRIEHQVAVGGVEMYEPVCRRHYRE